MAIDIAIFNFNGKETLETTLRTLLASKNVEIGNIYLVDDGSTDGSEKIAEEFDGVTLVQMPENTKNLNRVRNVGLKAAKTSRVLLTDNDLEFEPDCMEMLDKAMDEGEDIVAVTPMLMDMDERDRIFLDGNGFHYIGGSTTSNRGKVLKQNATDSSLSHTMSGGILLINKKILPWDFSFDEEIPFDWGCDGEFYYRMAFMGYRCLNNPRALAYHKVKERTVERAEGHVTTRWYMLLTYYSWWTLFLLLPMLILYELLLFAFFTMKGIPHLFLKYHFQSLKRLGATLKKRSEMQSRRRVKDSELLSNDDLYVSENLIRNPWLRYPFSLFNLLLKGYWGLIRGFL